MKKYCVFGLVIVLVVCLLAGCGPNAGAGESASAGNVSNSTQDERQESGNAGANGVGLSEMEQKLVGTWRNDLGYYGSETYQFNEDGTSYAYRVQFTDEKEWEAEGTWHIDGDMLVMKVSFLDDGETETAETLISSITDEVLTVNNGKEDIAWKRIE